MKNLKSLIFVVCLLVVLGCKCQSDMLGGLGKNDRAASPTPISSATPAFSPTPASTSQNRLLKTGTYTGTGRNVTVNKSGDFMLRIDSVDASGNVKAFFEASNGLYGRAALTGEVKSGGDLALDGTLDDGRAFSISATVEGDTISAGYGISDTSLKTESGNFTVRRK